MWDPHSHLWILAQRIQYSDRLLHLQARAVCQRSYERGCVESTHFVIHLSIVGRDVSLLGINAWRFLHQWKKLTI